MSSSIATNQTILVVGGGISGMTAALEAAECGKQVNSGPSVVPAWAVVRPLLYRYFPKMCLPLVGWRSICDA